jgi:ComF family protein
MIKRFIKLFDEFIFPKICLVCRKRINSAELENNFISKKLQLADDFCCFECKSKFQFAPPKEEILNNLLNVFDKNELVISNVVSLFALPDENNENNSPMNLIYKLKYFGFTKIGFEYGIWLGNILAENDLKNYDFIVPVPIHKVKKRERGYNQSDFIAKGVQQIIEKPILTDLLIRKKYTISQTLLSSSERKNNLENAFELNKKFNISGKNILLIDDVLTTGSTVNHCAITLLENSASKVDVATLIKA